ncbi:aminoglycoside N(3)-acetyltransferase [Streptomyces sp. NPDC059340]|uniref:aminoglycoside N(3)-acetyltransferase n=1 Tax=Streptomyces sp. NPDC059340 TaxID=3346806 RepID=UPI0036A63253
MTSAHSAEGLGDALRGLGLREGDVVLVHASLRNVGRTEQGAATVVDALRRAVGPTGTIVVPAFTEANSLTSRAHREQIRGMTDEQVVAFRAAMPAFDPATTPSTGMGAVAERLRTTPGARRSDHPQTSMAATGPLAHAITAHHPLDCHLGEASPLGHLYCLRAQVLLLGVGFERCTALHLAEYRLPNPPRRTYSCVLTTGDGLERGRSWTDFEDVALDDGDFAELGSWLEGQALGSGQPLVRHGRIGSASARLLPLSPAVDFAVPWLQDHRSTQPQGWPFTQRSVTASTPKTVAAAMSPWVRIPHPPQMNGP